MSRPVNELLARLVLAHGLLSEAQVAAALRPPAAGTPAASLGLALVEGGLLTHEQVASLLAAAGDGSAAAVPPELSEEAGAWRLARLALARRLASAEQVNRALREQVRRAAAGESHVPLGRILVEQGAMTDEDVGELLRLRSTDAVQPVGARPNDATIMTDRAALDSAPAPLQRDSWVEGVTIGSALDAGPAPVPAAATPPVPSAHEGRPAAATQGAPVRPSDAGAAAGRPVAFAPLPMRRAFGKYELVQELGRGGMGVVYKAYRTDLKAYFAVKVLLAGEDASPESVERFQREAQASARLRHPGIVAVHDIGVEEGKAYFAMEYVEGVGLDRVLDDPAKVGLKPPGGRGAQAGRRGLAVRDAVRITQEVAEAIDHAHRQGVVHRDLKPANILLDTEGRPRVVDFGLAKLLEPDGSAAAASRRTRTGVVLGTLAYMPPEQAEGGGRRIDARTDVYSLGALLYELVTGRAPFQAHSEAELLMMVLAREPQRPRLVNPELPRDLETVIGKAMEKDQARRYSTAGELAADLARFLDGQAIQARPPSVAYRMEKWVRRRRGLVAAVIALVLVGAAAAVSAWRARVAEAEKAELRRKVLIELREMAALHIDASLTLRRSGASLKKVGEDYLAQLQASVKDVEAEEPERAEPSYHLGRMYRALMLFDRALKEQERALGKEPDFTPALYEHAALLVHAHALRLRLLREDAAARGCLRATAAGAEAAALVIPDDASLEQDDAQAPELRKRLRADLEGLGRQVAAAAAARPDPDAIALTPAQVAAVPALARAYALAPGGDAAVARDGLLAVAKVDATLDELYEARATLAALAGDWDAMAEAYARGIEKDKGFLPFWSGRACARWRSALLHLKRGDDPAKTFADALADVTKVVDADPRSPAAVSGRGVLATICGVCRTARSEAPTELYGTALADHTKALSLDSAWTAALWRRGLLHQLQGRWSEAVADYRAARKLDPAAEPFFRAEVEEASRHAGGGK